MPRRRVNEADELPVYNIVFAPEARDDLVALQHYISQHSGTARAKAYFDKFAKFLALWQVSPRRGEQVDTIRPGLRVTNFQRSLIIAFHIREKDVVVDRCFYRGRNWRRILKQSVETRTGSA